MLLKQIVSFKNSPTHRRIIWYSASHCSLHTNNNRIQTWQTTKLIEHCSAETIQAWPRLIFQVEAQLDAVFSVEFSWALFLQHRLHTTNPNEQSTNFSHHYKLFEKITNTRTLNETLIICFWIQSIHIRQRGDEENQNSDSASNYTSS